MDRSALLLRLKAEIAVEKLTVAEKQSPLLRKGLFAYIRLAERVGFEPTIRFPVYTLSKRAPSATRPSLRLGAGGL